MALYLLAKIYWKAALYLVILYICPPRISAVTSMRHISLTAYGRGLYSYISTGCGIGDLSDDFDKIQPNSSIRGHFAYNVLCDGNITSVNAQGFCFRGNQSLPVFLIVVLVTNLHPFEFIDHFIPVTCDTSPFNGSDFYAGNITDDSVEIPVLSGHALAVRFLSFCSDEICLFQPAIINEIGSSTFYNDKLQQVDIGPISLLFSATITTGTILGIASFSCL